MRTRTMMIVGGAGSVFAVVAVLVWTMGLAAPVGAEEQAAAAPLIASAKVSADRVHDMKVRLCRNGGY